MTSLSLTADEAREFNRLFLESKREAIRRINLHWKLADVTAKAIVALEESCLYCELPQAMHPNGKCLFSPTLYAKLPESRIDNLHTAWYDHVLG